MQNTTAQGVEDAANAVGQGLAGAVNGVDSAQNAVDNVSDAYDYGYDRTRNNQ